MANVKSESPTMPTVKPEGGKVTASAVAPTSGPAVNAPAAPVVEAPAAESPVKSAGTAPVSEKTVPVKSAAKVEAEKKVAEKPKAKPVKAKAKPKKTAAKAAPKTAVKRPVKAKKPETVKAGRTVPVKPSAALIDIKVPFETFETINSEVANAAVGLNETVSDFISSGIDRGVSHAKAISKVTAMDELYAVNSAYFEAEFDRWMTASMKALETGNLLAGRMTEPVESLTKTLKDRFAA